MSSLPIPPPADRQMTYGSPLFSDFDSYYEALCESLNTEFYGEKYPHYQKYTDIGGTDLDIIIDLLYRTDNVQKAFDNFLKTLMNGTRYAGELLEFGGDKIFQEFLKHNVTINWDIIYNYYPEDNSPDMDAFIEDGSTFEDYSDYCRVRGKILDILRRIGVILNTSLIDDYFEDEFPEEVTFFVGHYQMIKFWYNYYMNEY
jgi:hypothetical protein